MAALHRPRHRGKDCRAAGVLAGLAALAFACARPQRPHADPPAPATAARPAPVTYTDVTGEAGIEFRHVSGIGPDRHLVETLGAGACWLDADQDGLLDLFLVQSVATAAPGATPPSPSRLYRNAGGGRFTDATESSGLVVTSRGMGCVSADYDNDGRADVYVTGLGANQLFHGEGGGRFTDVTARAGVGDPRLSTSASFGDFDGNGFLDIYVANYVPFDPATDPVCIYSSGIRSYCHPNEYLGERDSLYMNRGDGTFEDASLRALPAPTGDLHRSEKGLGVATCDYDGDGDLDLFVANDSCPNFLLRNRGDGTFEDVALAAGVALDLNGAALAGMGADWGDYDGDGLLDVFTTHFELEANTLYRNLGGGAFRDASYETGMAAPSLPFLGFGTRFTDADLDGDPDVLVANGHIFPDIAAVAPGRSYPQRMQYFRNDGPPAWFVEATASAGAALAVPHVGRGLAVADHDEDGDEDVVMTSVDEPALLLRNDGGNARSWIAFRLEGTRSNRDGVAARIEIVAGGRAQVAEVAAGGSYLSGHDLRRRFGLGTLDAIERVTIRWPSGTIQEMESLAARRVHHVVEPAGDPR